MKINSINLIFAMFLTNASFSQVSLDTTAIRFKKKEQLKFEYKQIIIPTILIGYGIVGLESGQIKGFNSEIKEEVSEHIDEKVTIDDFSQYFSIASLYGLQGLGIKGKNKIKDKTIILATSYILMGLTVNMLKKQLLLNVQMDQVSILFPQDILPQHLWEQS